VVGGDPTGSVHLVSLASRPRCCHGCCQHSPRIQVASRFGRLTPTMYEVGRLSPSSVTPSKGGAASPILCSTCDIERRDRLLQRFVTKSQATDSEPCLGGQPSCQDPSAVGPGTSALRLSGHSTKTGVDTPSSNRSQPSTGSLGQSLVWQPVVVDTAPPSGSSTRLPRPGRPWHQVPLVAVTARQPVRDGRAQGSSGQFHRRLSSIGLRKRRLHPVPTDLLR
jgi:hypothetical protein